MVVFQAKEACEREDGHQLGYLCQTDWLMFWELKTRPNQSYEILGVSG